MESLVQRIIEVGLVTQEQADTAALEAGKINRPVWYALVKLDYLSEESIVRFFAQEAHIPYVHLPDYRIKQAVLKILDEHFCRQNTVIPLWLVQERLFVACNNPFNMALLDAIGKLSGSSVELLIATSTAINQALDYYWRIDTLGFDMANFIVSPPSVKGFPLWRESERIAVDWPASITVQDDALALVFGSRIEGRTHDISRDGTAIGIYLPLYLPKGLNVMVEIQRLETAGEIVHVYMHNSQKFSIGVRFSHIDTIVKQGLIKIAEQRF